MMQTHPHNLVYAPQSGINLLLRKVALKERREQIATMDLQGWCIFKTIWEGNRAMFIAPCPDF